MTDRNRRGTATVDNASADLPGGTQSIQRAVALLRILATARETGLGLTEISKHAELTRPTTHRLLSILVAEGIVEQRPGTRRYAVGEQIPLLALARRKRDPLLDIVSPHLRAAVAEIGDAGFLTRRAGLDTVCVARQLVLLCHKRMNCGKQPIPDSFWGLRWISGPRRVWRRVLLSISSI